MVGKRFSFVSLRPLVGLVTSLAIFMIAFASLVNWEDGDASKDSDFLQRNRVIENVVIKGVALDTEVNYTIETSTLMQFPEKGLSELVNPRISQIAADGVERILIAESGKYFEDKREVLLEGNVRITVSHPNQANTIESKIDELRFALGDLEN